MTIGINNIATGYESLQENTAGNDNVATGVRALQKNRGSNNVAYGRNALGANTTGVNNLAIGFNAGALYTTGSHNIALGHTGNAGETATLRLGQNQTRAFIAGVRTVTNLTGVLPVYINASGQLGVVASSERFKEDIRDMATASEQVMNLRPVTYRYQASAAAPEEREYGLIAEEVAQVYPDLVTHGADGRIEAVQYHKLTPMLLNEVQRMGRAAQLAGEEAQRMSQEAKQMSQRLTDEQAKTAAQAQQISKLQQQVAVVDAQQQRLEALEARLLGVEQQHRTQRVASNP